MKGNTKMKGNRKISAAVLAVLIIAIFVCMFFANSIQTNGGTIAVTEGCIESEVGNIAYKLYTPENATEANPAPGVLLLHGYQNDHETCAAYAIELARRGVVVMAIDEYGHGATEPGLINRGYVNHKITVNFGEDSEADGTYVQIGGQNRYKVMMNFSNLSFFDDHYTKDDAGNSVSDSSCGGIIAYAALADMPNVDSTRLGLSGHSMGTWSSWSVAAAYSGTEIEPKATVLQCGELFRDSAYDSENIKFNNVLLLQAKYDEFSYFRDYKNVVNEDLLRSDLRTEFLGTTAADAEWNTTFGSFNDGSARRIELLMTNHRLTTHNSHGIATAMQWFDDALDINTSIAPTDQKAMIKETLVLVAMFCAIAAMIPLMELLLTVPFFAKAAQPLPSKDGIKKGRKWWKGATITVLIAFATYPFMTQLGHGLLPLPENIFRMTIGNGFLSWYSLLIIIMAVTSITSYKKAKKAGGNDMWYSMGLGSAEKPNKMSWGLLGRSAVLSLCMLALMYILVSLCEKFFKLDFRFIWPFFKSFNLVRFGQFLVYIVIFVVFFILNNSKIMASMRCEGTYQEGFKGFFASWWRNALLMVGGILLLCLLEYIPFFMDIGPGADLLFSSTFGGPFMSLMILFVPQVLVFSVLCTYIYRRTGNVYTGAITVASMACWIVAGGSSML